MLNTKTASERSSHFVTQSVISNDVFRGSLPLQPPPALQKACEACLTRIATSRCALAISGGRRLLFPISHGARSITLRDCPQVDHGLTRASGRGRVGSPLPSMCVIAAGMVGVSPCGLCVVVGVSLADLRGWLATHSY